MVSVGADRGEQVSLIDTLADKGIDPTPGVESQETRGPARRRDQLALRAREDRRHALLLRGAHPRRDRRDPRRHRVARLPDPHEGRRRPPRASSPRSTDRRRSSARVACDRRHGVRDPSPASVAVMRTRCVSIVDRSPLFVAGGRRAPGARPPLGRGYVDVAGLGPGRPRVRPARLAVRVGASGHRHRRRRSDTRRRGPAPASVTFAGKVGGHLFVTIDHGGGLAVHVLVALRARSCTRAIGRGRAAVIAHVRVRAIPATSSPASTWASSSTAATSIRSTTSASPRCQPTSSGSRPSGPACRRSMLGGALSASDA